MTSKKKTFDPELAAKIGTSVRSRRVAAGMTQRQLAGLSGMTHASVHEIETGATIPGGILVRGLARALGATPNDILQWEES